MIVIEIQKFLYIRFAKNVVTCNVEIRHSMLKITNINQGDLLTFKAADNKFKVLLSSTLISLNSLV